MIPRMYKKVAPNDLDCHLPTYAYFDIDKFQDVNLLLEKNYTRDSGMRVNIQQTPCFIELETIVDNIKHKRFQIHRPIDKYLNDRIDKMSNRGWTQLGEPLSVIPERQPHYYAVLVPLHYSKDAYEAMKNILRKQCTGFIANELKLFHGTKDAAIKGITEDGFDDRYFNRDGHGANFADGARKSHGYTAFDNPDHTHVMFYNKVLLGNNIYLS